jgi:hypothetical protein
MGLSRSPNPDSTPHGAVTLRLTESGPCGPVVTRKREISPTRSKAALIVMTILQIESAGGARRNGPELTLPLSTERLPMPLTVFHGPWATNGPLMNAEQLWKIARHS